jgi:DNA-binding FrmR family transcriptional regulator
MITLQHQQKITTNLKKAQGMITKIQSMIDDQQYCADIATQVNATIWLLKVVNKTLLENHLSCCGPALLNASDQGKKDAFIAELMRNRGILSK